MPTRPTKANGFGGRGIADCLNLCGLRGISAGKVCRRHGPLPGRYLTCSRLAVVNRVRPPCWQQFLMETYGGPAQPSPSIGQCLNGGYGWLEVECHRCKIRASIPLESIRRPRDTPIWKFEAALKCRSCRKGRYAPPVQMIKLTQEPEITPYPWVHPDEDDRG
jgi:hypothetical protein